MSGFVFFDSNVLVYSDDGSSKAKQRRAIDLIARHLGDGTAVFSLQVLQEYFAVSTRKFKVPAETAQQKVQIFARAKVVCFTPSDVIDSASSIRCAVLLRKKERKAVEMEPDYVAFDIPNAFVVGYGLDYQDAYRNLPYVAALEEHEIGQAH